MCIKRIKDLFKNKTMKTKENNSIKDLIAKSVTFVSLGFIILISAFAVYKNCDEGFDFLAKSILPLVGTWMGVILAFYYSKENFQAASDSVQKMADRISSVRDKLHTISVKDAMINSSKIEKMDNAMESTIQQMIDFLKTKKIQRLPIIENDIVKYVIHQSTLTSFISSKALNPSVSNDTLSKLTIKDILDDTDEELKNYIRKGVEVVSVNASLFDIWEKMQNNKYCQDVFITKNGNSDEPIMGWVTDNIVREKADK